MSGLPNPSDFKKKSFSFSQPSQSNKHVDTTIIMNLKKFHSDLVLAKNQQIKKVLFYETDLPSGLTNPTTLLYELYSSSFLRSIKKNKIKVLNKYIGYSRKYESLTISILDENNDIKTIAIREAFNQDGKKIKWKSYGKKSFVPSKFTGKPIVFLAVGMSEYILFELLEYDYILLQSDGMYRHICEKALSYCSDKFVVVLKENDESFNKLVEHLKGMFQNLILIDFEILTKTELPKSYDFRDYCNEIADINEIEKKLEAEIVKQLKEKSYE